MSLVNDQQRSQLSAIQILIWDLLVDGVVNRRSAFHTPSVATVGRGRYPEVRTVVLRHASRDKWELGFNTDRRSSKHRSLTENPHVAWHVYDPSAKIQFRCCGIAGLHHDDDWANAAWQRSKPMSRVCYSQLSAPGAVLFDPDEARIEAEAEDRFGWQNFVAVKVQLKEIEWLHLKAGDNRRAKFCRDEAGKIGGCWLAP